MFSSVIFCQIYWLRFSNPWLYWTKQKQISQTFKFDKKRVWKIILAGFLFTLRGELALSHYSIRPLSMTRDDIFAKAEKEFSKIQTQNNFHLNKTFISIVFLIVLLSIYKQENLTILTKNLTQKCFFNTDFVLT